MIAFEYKTEPFACQRDQVENHAGDAGRGLWWEAGVGKSKGAIDTFAKLYCEGEVKGHFVLAPNGLHRNFITKEIPKHLMDPLAERARMLYWRTDKAATKWHQELAAEFLAYRDGPLILAMSYDGLMTEPGRAFAKEFLTQFRCLYTADETQRIAEPKADRTIRVLASGPFAPYRQGLTGTPVKNAPWDVHTQIKFLDTAFWRPHGLDSPEAMKAAFGVWEKVTRRVPLAQAKRGKALTHYYDANNIPEELRTTFRVPMDEAGKPRGPSAFMQIPKLSANAAGRPMYRNLDRLKAIIEPIRSRVLKSDCFDLPPKLHTPLEFDLGEKQRNCYDQMQKMGFVLTESGEPCTANLALTLLLRLQQIACGYLVTDIDPTAPEEPRVRPIAPNPRMDLLLEITEDLAHPSLIWARFRADIDQILAGLKKQGKAAARYDGAITDEECAANENLFHSGDIQFLVLNQAKGGEGLTLIEAQTAIYYSNSFKLLERLQSSERPYRYGQTHTVNEIDLMARGTVDEKIVASLCGKYDMASMVTGDQLKEWLLPLERFL